MLGKGKKEKSNRERIKYITTPKDNEDSEKNQIVLPVIASYPLRPPESPISAVNVALSSLTIGSMVQPSVTVGTSAPRLRAGHVELVFPKSI